MNQSMKKLSTNQDWKRSWLVLSTTLRLLTHVPNLPRVSKVTLCAAFNHLCSMQGYQGQCDKVVRSTGISLFRVAALLYRNCSVCFSLRPMLCRSHIYAHVVLWGLQSVEKPLHTSCAQSRSRFVGMPADSARGIFYTHGLHLSSSLLLLASVQSSTRRL